MPTPKESRIEDFAYTYLQSYYAARYNNKNIYVFKSEETKQGTQVDGLFAFSGPERSIVTASLNTSYSAKLAALLGNYKKSGLSRLRYASAVVAGLAPLLLYPYLGIYPAVAAAVIIMVAAFFAHSALELTWRRNKIRNFVATIASYPANEKWIGLSISSLSFRANPLADHFLALCSANGIGIITVGKRAKVVLKQEPVAYVPSQNDFLSEYKSADTIRTAVLTNSVLKVA